MKSVILAEQELVDSLIRTTRLISTSRRAELSLRHAAVRLERELTTRRHALFALADHQPFKLHLVLRDEDRAAVAKVIDDLRACCAVCRAPDKDARMAQVAASYELEFERVTGELSVPV